MKRTVRMTLWASGPLLIVIGLLLRWLHFSTDQQVLYYGADPLLLSVGITAISVVLLVLAIWLLAFHDAEADRLAAAERRAAWRLDRARTHEDELKRIVGRQRTTLRSGVARVAGRAHLRLLRSGAAESRQAVELGLGEVLGIRHVLPTRGQQRV